MFCFIFSAPPNWQKIVDFFFTFSTSLPLNKNKIYDFLLDKIFLYKFWFGARGLPLVTTMGPEPAAP